MTAYELIAIVMAFLSGLGTFVAWLFNQERLTKIEKKAETANRIALQANDLSNAANLVSKQALQAEVNKFRYQKLEIIVKDLDQHIRDYKKFNIQKPERRDTLLKGLLIYLVHMKKFEIGIFEDQRIPEIVAQLIQNIDGFLHKSYEYESASEDYKHITGANNLTVLLNINKDPEMQAAAQHRSTSYKKLTQSSKIIDDNSKLLLKNISQELNSALREASNSN